METLRNIARWRTIHGGSRTVLGVALGMAATVLAVPASGQSGPSRLHGPLPPPAVERPAPAEQGAAESQTAAPKARDGDANLFEREVFRRRAAEAAQRQLENLADQLREQLGREIDARRTAETKLADLVSRTALSDQLDRERQRVREGELDSLKSENAQLSGELVRLTQRLSAEVSERRTLAAKLFQTQGSSGKTGPASDERIAELERKLNAAEWKRRLAEAQLKILQNRQSEPAN